MAISLPFTQTTRSIISKQTLVKYNQMEKDVATIRLVFTRHGQTEENAKGIICGQQPGTLTKIGVTQAKKIGVYLKDQNEQFDQIYVSDLGRTVATFENIKSQAKHLDKIPVVLTKLLRQKGGGVLEGKPLITWKQQAQKQKKDIRVYKCAKGESWCDVNQRCWDFLKLLVETHIMKVKKQQELTKVFAVSHGGYLMEFHNMVAKIMQKKDPVFKNTAKNCSLHDFIIEYPTNSGPDFKIELVSIKCVRQNFVDHLLK